MTIELIAGQAKELNVQLTPIVDVEALTINELFIGTRRWGFKTSSDCAWYLTLGNPYTFDVSGTVTLYEWQTWWGEGWPERRKTNNFTIPAGGIRRFCWTQTMLEDDLAYIRFEVKVNDTIVLETLRLWFLPGKVYMGESSEAVGECFYTSPGHATLWYSQRSENDHWDGYYRTPPPMDGPAIHSRSLPYYKLSRYGSWDSWPAIYAIVFDPDFISGARYWAEVTGGPHYKQAWFQWIQE